jgi:hypothetical protein
MARGRAARVAYDPAVVLAFLDAHTTYEKHGKHNRTCRLINGHPIPQDITARTIRRWRNSTEGITRRGLVTMLRKIHVTVGTFEEWALDQGRNPFIRNKEL